jgi:preprotein translocase SecE subunit
VFLWKHPRRRAFTFGINIQEPCLLRPDGRCGRRRTLSRRVPARDGGWMSNQRYITLAFIIGAVIVWAAMRSATVEIMASAGIPDPQILNINSTSIVAVVSAIVAFIVLLRNTRAVTFVDEVVVELRKMFWPKREETVNSTTVVLIATISLSVAIALYDFLWAKITSTFLFS